MTDDVPVLKSFAVSNDDETGAIVVAVQTDQGLIRFSLTRHQSAKMARALSDAHGQEPPYRH